MPDAQTRPLPGPPASGPPVPAPAVPGADARQAVAELAGAGALTELYGPRPTGRVDPRTLRRLLADAAARGPQGTVLALLVQLATALPLLTETAQAPTATAVRDAALGGRALLALAATDEQAGSDLTALTTTVDLDGGPDGDQVTVNGTKRWVTSALTADHALVLARHRPGRHFTNFTWVLVPLTAPGVTVRPAATELFEGSGVGHLELSGVVLSRDHLLGRTGRGLALFARHMAVERLASAAWAIELCRGAIADTDRRLRARQVDDTPLRESASVRQRLADCAVQVSSLHALWTASCDRIADGHDATAAAVLKAASGTTVERVMTTCAQLQGADGFGTGGIQQLRAESAVFAIGGGATEVVLDTVAGRLDLVLNELTP
ncbi:acyl-CoA dehydrogenase family protein [Streptomyces sp. Rer75]|uniref:acyl-CoA dehydrogenase family protein n=1 Tax=Streptomyces sp. Rer75 TaxID=2750011 RepID=UPI0015D0126D|nr:acyl-CoA dehydrogenase [Streptomyces sp. Rer75]QLH24150.1 acyl-CoA dehydrogenase [Streptomyces sp. Rer75]